MLNFTVKNGIKFGFGLALGRALYRVADRVTYEVVKPYATKFLESKKK